MGSFDDCLERRAAAARVRNQTYMVVYSNQSENDPRCFIDEYKTSSQMDHGHRYWRNNYGFFVIKTIDLWPNESHLQRTRRLRRRV